MTSQSRERSHSVCGLGMARVVRGLAFASVLGGWLLRPAEACAEDTVALSEDVEAVIAPSRTTMGFAALDRPTGIAEFGFGWLTLPGASICVGPLTRCSEGDTSFLLDAWQLYRGSRRFAFGAGIMLGLIPTNNPPQPAGREREHSRQYFTVEGIVRYYPYVGQNWEWWAGITGGLVVVNDRFEVEAKGPDRALLGPRGVTIRTEGGSLGLAGGPVIALTQNWAIGIVLRYGHWFVPEKPAVDPFGSSASLTGANTVVSLGINIAFRTVL